jgi:4-alpha-glucanotransferase
MRFSRSGGLLLHLTSLSGRFGIGDLGDEAYHFVDFLAAHKQHLWQILPLGPTSEGNFHSPYVALSAFAGNPLLISLDRLVRHGLLPGAAVESASPLPEGSVDFARVSELKFALLRLASARFLSHASSGLKDAFAEFCTRQRWWLDDYALFMALREIHGDASWHTWDPDLVRRVPHALDHWRERLAQEILFYRHLQFFFFTQWAQLKTYANQHGVQIFGDLPIYVAFDSVEVWSQPELFELDPQTYGPVRIAGVPPDLFSETGQRWGNPLYRWWDEHDRPVQPVYAWWVQRFRSALAMVDLLRVDHFRGFEAYWAIPAEEETAVNGQWEKGPGAGLFTILQEMLEDLPVVAEDLGIITPQVEALRRQFGFPGMKVLQFSFGGDARNPYLPHNYTDPRHVVYTGTHDNDTILGWFRSLTPECREAVLRYLGQTESVDLHWDMIRLAWSSIALLAIVPLQDILGLGSEGRMNLPGQPEGNWHWRYLPEALTNDAGARLAELTRIYGREVD